MSFFFISLDLDLDPPSLLLSSLVLPFPLLLALHHTAFALQSLCTGLLPRALAVDVEAHVPLLVQIEELLEELCDIVVGLGGCLHEGALPAVGLVLPILGFHLAMGFITLVSHKHNGDGLHVAFYGQDLQKKCKKKTLWNLISTLTKVFNLLYFVTKQPQM